MKRSIDLSDTTQRSRGGIQTMLYPSVDIHPSLDQTLSQVILVSLPHGRVCHKMQKRRALVVGPRDVRPLL